MKRIQTVATTTEYDGETGEIKKQSTTRVAKIPSEPPYVKQYLEDIHNLFRLPVKSRELIDALLKELPYSGKIYLHRALKLRIAQSMGYTSANADKQLMKKIGVLVDECQ